MLDVEPRDPRTIRKDLAGDLADFSIGVEAARDTPVYQTHLAHSYGTLVDALALKHVNMPVRALGWAGSPSTPARSALELGVKPGALNVFRGQTDPVPFIGLLQWFGPDPAEIAGARDLRTEPRTWADGRRTAGSEGHSQYFAADTTAVRSVGRILVGVDRDHATCNLLGRWGSGACPPEPSDDCDDSDDSDCGDCGGRGGG